MSALGEAQAAVATVITAAAATTTTAVAAATVAHTAARTAAATTCLPRPWAARASRAAAIQTIATTAHAAPWPHHNRHRRHHQPHRHRREDPQCEMSGARKAPAAGSIRRTTGPALAAAAVRSLYLPGPSPAVAAASPPQTADHSHGFLRLRASQKALLRGMVAVETITTIAGAVPSAVALAVEAPAVQARIHPLPWVEEATRAASQMVGWEIALVQGTDTRRGVACVGIEPLEHICAPTMRALVGAGGGMSAIFRLGAALPLQDRRQKSKS